MPSHTMAMLALVREGIWILQLCWQQQSFKTLIM